MNDDKRQWLVNNLNYSGEIAESPRLARKANNPPSPQKKDMKIITQNIRSFNPIINSAKQRKTDKFKK